ncbi:tannase/feruloyl esterase family alpha/beta hydrolase [Variovorax sp. PCZ-1]|uniref:tannase/feruloyl esterase family alpha/beta hydrolase n=1 Tax=Variovorax sp. PCZ-1 TaxID=2835533 RepID=UPI0020BEA505|nr:tannase/feruloyl esterase family alpha/beta hydrolase [Variovorax sp. PCZ-1]
MAKLSEAKPATLSACAQLPASFKFDKTRLESAENIAAGKLGAGAQTTAYNAPEHCLVKGKMHERKGVNDQDFAIQFEMRLPKDWNGRFYYQANGGIDGVVQLALGAHGGGPLTGALAQGFAVISSDAGHTGRQNPRFGEDPQARADYGYLAVGKLTPMAKQLIAAAYGKAPDRSYIGGCSNGGRHAMIAASRYQNDYDGFLIGAPGYRLPNAAVAQMWALPGWQALATPGASMTHPFNPSATIANLNTALSPAERQTVATAILGKCDALDGAKDGLVQDTAACQKAFDLNRDVATCASGSGARNGSCLSAEQKTQLTAVHTGGKTRGGSVLYSSFPWDAGISAANWAQWKFVNSQILDPAAGYIFMTPPRSIPNPFALNVDEAYAAIYATNAAFPESANTQITPPGKFSPENLIPLRQRGAKILAYHGVSDAIFSHDDTAAWINRVNDSQNGKAAEFARYYPVPGMAHCGAGGPTVDQFDPLTPLVNWVERGVAPQQIIATARGTGNAAGANAELPKDWSANRTRPLCPFPSKAMYNGSGNIEDAASFSCK